MAGQLRLYDVRSPNDVPSRIMVSSETLVALCAVDHNPTQGHILATGGADGCVTLFDSRKECAPVTKLQIHKEDGEREILLKKRVGNCCGCLKTLYNNVYSLLEVEAIAKLKITAPGASARVATSLPWILNFDVLLLSFS